MTIVKVDHLSYCVRDHLLLDDLSFICQIKERVGIEGLSGVGKSSLLALLAGLAFPTKGSIILEGNASLKDRSIVGYVPQENFFLEEESILFNAMLAVHLKYPRQKEKRSHQVIEWMKWLELPIEGSPNALSGGEKRKLSLIRALALRPRILLADEWSSGLDVLNQRKIWSLFEECPCVISVTHDSQVTALCNRRYLLQKGKLLAF